MEYIYGFEYGQYNKTEDIPDVVTVSVDGHWHNILTTLDKEEYNDAHRENRRHISYEKLEQLDDYLIPKQLYDDERNPVNILIDDEKRDMFWSLYDKILRGTGVLSKRQLQAFQYRLLCEMSFEQVAYVMRFDFPPNESIQLAKKHYYNAIRKLRKLYLKDYKQLKKKFNLQHNYIKIDQVKKF